MSEELKAADLNMDAIDQTCMILKIDGDGCRLMREAAVEVYGKKEKKTRKKRAPSKYNIFMGECVKGKTGDVKVRFKECAVEWKEEKIKRGVEV